MYVRTDRSTPIRNEVPPYGLGHTKITVKYTKEKWSLLDFIKVRAYWPKDTVKKNKEKKITNSGVGG